MQLKFVHYTTMMYTTVLKQHRIVFMQKRKTIYPRKIKKISADMQPPALYNVTHVE